MSYLLDFVSLSNLNFMLIKNVRKWQCLYHLCYVLLFLLTNKGPFTYYVISRGGGGFEMITLAYGGEGGGLLVIT